MDGSLLLKIITILLIVNAIYASYAHHEGKLTIYVDWTDAVATGASPLVALGVMFTLLMFNVPDDIASTVAVGVFCAFAILALRMSWKTNPSLPSFLVASMARFTVLIAVYGCIVLVIAQHRRYKYEHRKTASNRLYIEIAAVVASYVAWSIWISRNARFTPVENWLAGDSFALPEDGATPHGLQVATE